MARGDGKEAFSLEKTSSEKEKADGCRRLIWLNPLLGSPEYRPLTIGMKTALPYIDNFLPAHNLDGLINLGNLLGTIDDSRPSRSGAARRKAVAAWSKGTT